MIGVLFILVWLFLTIFSVIGGLGIGEIFPGLWSSDYTGLILIMNFYLSNILASIIGSVVSLGKLNRLLILLGTAILLLALEGYGTYYLYDEIFGVEWGFWSSSIFLLTLIFVLTFGGIRQILLVLFSSIKNGLITTIEEIEKNSFDSMVNENAKEQRANSNKSNKKTKTKNDSDNLDLYNY